MPWVRFDDQYPINRKVNRLSDAAFRFHTEAIFWCGRNLTDGHLSPEDLTLVSARVRWPERLADEFVRRGLWHQLPTECDSVTCSTSLIMEKASVDNQFSTGWVIHDYLQYQPSKEQVKRTRERNAKDQKAWRERHKPDSKTLTKALYKGTPVPSRPVIADVVNQPAGSNGRAGDDDQTGLIIKELLAVTGHHVTPEWAAKVRAHILDGRSPASPAAYIRQAIRSEPNPRLRFLEQG